MNTLLRRLIVGALLTSSGAVLPSTSLDAAGAAGATGALQIFEQRIGQIFEQRIGGYAALRQRAAASLPPLAPSDDVQWIEQQRADLAAAIIAARPNARQGNIFTSSVASAFRGIIRESLDGVDVAATLRDLHEECETPIGYRPQVNARYPSWATHEMPVVLLHALPALPKGLVYRLIDLNLVIWDVDADLIVDVLPDALLSPGS